MASPRIPCVGAVVRDGEGRLLLVRRGREPDRGLWSIPGGKVEPGETDAQAVVREVLEETALAVDVGEFVGAVERDAPGGGVYDVRDYLCSPAPGADFDAVRAGDDAADVGWFTDEQVRGAGCSPLLISSLEEWGVLE